MKEFQHAEIAVLKCMASRSEEFAGILLSLKCEWQPKSPPPYLVMAGYAEVLTIKQLPEHVLVLIFADVEDFFLAGGAVADLVAVGFLEALLGRASAGRFNFGDIVNLLGPKSLEFCVAWDQFTGSSTVVDVQQ